MPLAAAPPSAALNEHLHFLSSLPAEYITEFCKAALALLQQKAQGKMFSNAAPHVHTWHLGPSGAHGHGPPVRLLTPHRRPNNLVSSGRRWSRVCRRSAMCCCEPLPRARQQSRRAPWLGLGFRVAAMLVRPRFGRARTPAEQVLDGVELQLQPEALAALQSFYDEAAAELAQVSRRGPDLPAYHSLEWRLQVQLAGRHVLAGELQPSYLLRLHTEAARGCGAPRAEHLLQARSPHRRPRPSLAPRTSPSRIRPRPPSRAPCRAPCRAPSQHRGAPRPWRPQADFANLRHLATELDDALREETSTHSRRIARRVATFRDA